MKKQMILAISEKANFEKMPEALKKAISHAQIEWDLTMLSGSQVFDGKKLILINSGIEADQLFEMMNQSFSMGELDDSGKEIYYNFKLGWDIVAIEDELIDYDLLLPYFPDEIVYDEDGEEVDILPPNLVGKLQTWSGKSWIY